MSLLRREKIGRYTITCDEGLNAISAEKVIALIDSPLEAIRAQLGGRARIGIGKLEGIGRVVVKHYNRGGVFGRFISSRYLKWGKTRAEQEAEMLSKVAQLGVSVPLPLASIHRGGLFYRAWLITTMIEGAQTLAELSVKDEDRAGRLTVELIRQISLLVGAGIWHVDLHPGNVLVDSNDRLFIIDFDKACYFRGTSAALRDQYLFRWRRAVIKHNLPDLLSEIVCMGLKKNDEDWCAKTA